MFSLAVGGTAVPARGSVPSYPSPERAVGAVARVVRYTQWLSRPVGDFVVPPGCDLTAAREYVDSFGPLDTALVLDDDQGAELLRRVGIHVAPFRRARRPSRPRGSCGGRGTRAGRSS